MGIDSSTLRALLYAKVCGADFSKVVTLGRQSIHIKPEHAMRIFKRFKMAMSPSITVNIFNSTYAESLFEHLGAKSVDSLDASSYQGANIIHDLNTPILESMKSLYSMVIDCGTLEHIFNFPVAVSNLIEMTALGGHILSVVPANNFCGHGFYQFSPELFFRAFSVENGCEIRSLFLAASALGHSWHEVTDPHVIHERVTLQNHVPTNLIMLAVRRNLKEQEQYMPQQSDYKFVRWIAPRTNDPAEESARTMLARRFKRLLPLRIQSVLYAIRESTIRSGYRKGYKTVMPETLAAESRRQRHGI